MIALMASALLGLYVLLPDFLFRSFATSFVTLKKHQRTRTEEIVAGLAVAAVPFAITLVLSHYTWFFGHWPWPVEQSIGQKVKDYQTVLAGIYSEAYFNSNLSQFREAFSRIEFHQIRFACWNYFFLAIEIGIVVLATGLYGRLNQYPWYRLIIGRTILRKVSQWQVLLTPFVFPPGRKPKIMVDVLTKQDHLYDGTLADFFLDAEGSLTGLLFKDFRRFRFQHFEEDRRRAESPNKEAYWEPIPGANFVIPYENIANINIRYEFPLNVMLADIESILKDLDGIDADVSYVLTHPPEGPEPPPIDNEPNADGEHK